VLCRNREYTRFGVRIPRGLETSETALVRERYFLPGALHEWQATHAPPVFLQALQISSYLAEAIDGIPSDGSRAFALPNFTSGIKMAQVTWTQLLLAVRFSGSLGLTGLFNSSCFFLKKSATS
jgi:hypothetical protein